MAKADRAVLREAIQYSAEQGCATAPRGEYRVESHDNCVGLCECGGTCDFTLSLDAFQQHVLEGRISIR